MKIIFICKANVGRSQMAEAIFTKLSNQGSASSAGLDPGGWEGKKINSAKNLISCMKEIGYNLEEKISKKLTKEMVDNADKIIIIGEKENWPDYLINHNIEHWEIPDAGGTDLDFHRKIRDQIKNKVKELIKRIK